ncbi:hypothetical protein ABPG72_016458 [Tetrahymena utriculariae]
MNLKLSLISIFCIISLVLCGHIETGKGKSEALRQLASKSPNGIIHFNSTGFRYFLLEQPRPYEVVLFFTAPKCDFCEQMLTQYELTSNYYYVNNGHIPFKDNSKKLRAVYFGMMSFDQNTRETFLDLEFKSVPNLLVSVPQHALVSDSERNNFLKGFKWSISGSDGLVTHHKLLEYINKRTGREIEYQPPIQEVLRNLAILLILITLSIVVFRLYKSFFLNTKLWFVGSIVIYFVCIAGFIYNQIHGVPMTTVDSKGNFQWMLDNQRMQLGAEGFVMSGLIILSALTIISYQLIAKLNQKNIVNQLLFIAIFGTTLIIVIKIEELYKFKGWYNINFFPPSHYNRGPIMRDQGNSI